MLSTPAYSFSSKQEIKLISMAYAMRDLCEDSKGFKEGAAGRKYEGSIIQEKILLSDDEFFKFLDKNPKAAKMFDKAYLREYDKMSKDINAITTAFHCASFSGFMAGTYLSKETYKLGGDKILSK